MLSGHDLFTNTVILDLFKFYKDGLCLSCRMEGSSVKNRV